MLGVRLRRVGGWLIPRRRAGRARERGACVRFRGARTWELLWETLTESIDKLGLNGIRLDISLPSADEACHAFWERGSHEEHDWCLNYPLVINGREVGSLKVNGSHNGDSTCERIEQLVEMIEPFEKEVLAIAGVPRSDKGGEVPVSNRGQLKPSAREPVAAGTADAGQDAL